MSLRPDVSSLKEMAREALKASQQSLFTSFPVDASARAATEVIEHSVGHSSALFLPKLLKYSGNIASKTFRGALNTGAFGAGFAKGVAQGGYNAARGVAGAVYGYNRRNPFLKFDMEHGLSAGIGTKKLLGAGLLGAAALGLTQQDRYRQSMYSRDMDDPTLHRDSLNASGAMVTNSRRARY